MGKLTEDEMAAREHITRWLLYFREVFYVREGKPDRRLAEDLGVSPSLISNVAAGKKQVGFDVAMKMRRIFRRMLDELVYKLPPEDSEAAPDTPRHASSADTHQRKRHGNGRR